MFCLDFVVDGLFGGTSSGAAGNVDIVPRERRLIGVLVCECVVARRPRVVVVRGKRSGKDSRRVVRVGNRDADGERGSHGCVCLSLLRQGGFNFFTKKGPVSLFYLIIRCSRRSVVSHTVRCVGITNNAWVFFGQIDLALLTVVFADGQRRFDLCMELALGKIVQILVMNLCVPFAVCLVPSELFVGECEINDGTDDSVACFCECRHRNDLAF